VESTARWLCLVILGGCASGASFDWPEKNPFADYQNTNFEDYPSADLAKLDLVFSANVFGETDPCGCASGPKGGLDRRLNYLRMTPAFGDRLVVDAGNALFATEVLDPTRKDALQKRAKAILQGGQIMGIRAFNIGYLDLSAGVDFLKTQAKKNRTPFVSATLTATDNSDPDWYSPFVDVPVSKLNIRVTGLTAGRKDLPPNYKVIDPESALHDVLKSGQKPDFLVVLSDLGRLEDEKIMSQDWGIPTVIVSSRDLSSLDHPVVRGNQILVQPQFRGQQWGHLKIMTAPQSHGWFNLGQAAEFSSRWDEIHGHFGEYSKRQAGSERTLEINGQIAAARELLGQAPGEKHSVFTYELVEMGGKFVKANELTKIMKDVSEN
jgi:2',3'-cyclic-nucleotide 2'-phosphodiesterase (5'-nucleotidase family)